MIAYGLKRIALTRGTLTAAYSEQVDTLTQWYVGQWQWLTGFSFWTCLLSLLTKDYVGGFDYTHNWWLLLIVIFIVSVFVPFVYYTWLMDRCKSAPATSEVEDPAAQLWAQAVDKSISQIYKSTRWLFWIGVYLTSRQSFNTFDKALSQEE